MLPFWLWVTRAAGSVRPGAPLADKMTLPLVTTAAVVVTATGSVLVTTAPEVAAAAKVTVKYWFIFLL